MLNAVLSSIPMYHIVCPYSNHRPVRVVEEINKIRKILSMAWSIIPSQESKKFHLINWDLICTLLHFLWSGITQQRSFGSNYLTLKTTSICQTLVTCFAFFFIMIGAKSILKFKYPYLYLHFCLKRTNYVCFTRCCYKSMIGGKHWGNLFQTTSFSLLPTKK